MPDSILAESQNATSGRRALVCDEGASVWLYLSDPDGQSIATDCWLFNTVAAPNDLAGFRDRDGSLRRPRLLPSPEVSVGRLTQTR